MTFWRFIKVVIVILALSPFLTACHTSSPSASPYKPCPPHMARYHDVNRPHGQQWICVGR